MSVVEFWDNVYQAFDCTVPVSGELELPLGFGPICNKDVLIIACGTGEHVIRACRAGAKVTALDISPRAVENALAMAKHNGFDIKTVIADGAATELPDGSFDVIWGSAVLHHLDHDRAASEFARLLRSEGKVAMVSEPTFFNPLLRFAYQTAFGEGREGRRRSAFFGLLTRIGDDYEKPIEQADLVPWTRHFKKVELYPRGFLFFSKLGQVLPCGLPVKKFFLRLDGAVIGIIPSITRWSYEYDFVFSMDASRTGTASGSR